MVLLDDLAEDFWKLHVLFGAGDKDKFINEYKKLLKGVVLKLRNPDLK